MGIASLPIEIQLILVPTILFALTFHEYAHARVAYLLGDYTSYYQNRMNLNPFNHLDPFGTFALYFLGFGWAKPVPVSIQNLQNPVFHLNPTIFLIILPNLLYSSKIKLTTSLSSPYKLRYS